MSHVRPEIIAQLTGSVRHLGEADYRAVRKAIADTYGAGHINPPMLTVHTGVLCVVPNLAEHMLIISTARFGRPRVRARFVAAALRQHRFPHAITVFTPEAPVPPEEQSMLYHP